MGIYFADQYSYLHWCIGAVLYFMGMSFEKFLFLHIFYEIFENTSQGMNVINKYITFWPGKKNYPDTLSNSMGDTFFGILGWSSAKYIFELGIKKKWHPLHSSYNS